MAAALGSEPLTEESVSRHIAPLFSRTLASRDIYLANHSLGRPLDQTALDVAEAAQLWQTKLGDAWEEWLAEREAFRARLARLINAPRPDCVVPKTSAGQGLRTVLNALPGQPRVLTTRGEFDSLDVILKQYAARGRIRIRWIEAGENGHFNLQQLIDAVSAGTDLVVVAQVMFLTAQIMHELDTLTTACHANGARLLVDAYHSIAVFPVDVAAMRADFLIGGSYKYLRGGPGAGFLYISPEALASGLEPLDIGWFGKQDPFAFERPETTRWAAGGNAFLESTPPIFTYYQARAGQQFTLAVGVERLRAYSLDRLVRMKRYLAGAGVTAIGGDSDHGAFLTISHPDAASVCKELAAHGVEVDARADLLRVCPDCLTREEEVARAADMIGGLLRSR